MAKNEDEEPFSLNLSGKLEDSPWWAKDISAVLKPLATQMLQEYAGILPDQLVEHIEKTVSGVLHAVPCVLATNTEY